MSVGPSKAYQRHGYSRTTSVSCEAAIQKVTGELKAEGFGVITTIDVKEKRTKLERVIHAVE